MSTATVMSTMLKCKWLTLDEARRIASNILPAEQGLKRARSELRAKRTV